MIQYNTLMDVASGAALLLLVMFAYHARRSAPPQRGLPSRRMGLGVSAAWPDPRRLPGSRHVALDEVTIAPLTYGRMEAAKAVCALRSTIATSLRGRYVNEHEQTIAALDRYIDDHLDESLADLTRLTAIPSVSSKGEHMDEAARFVAELLDGRGLQDANPAHRRLPRRLRGFGRAGWTHAALLQPLRRAAGGAAGPVGVATLRRRSP